MSASGRLAGKTVVVTGAGRGQGLAESTLLAAAGARVIACDVAVPDDAPAAVDFRTLDVRSPADWQRLTEVIDRKYGGRVDGLVNNAGVTWRDRLLDVDVEEWNRVFAVNCTGMLLAIQALAPRMTEGASIVNLGSAAAFVGHYPVAYTVSKWAVRGLSAVAALELGVRGIRVNTVHPGFIETEMTASAPAAFREATAAVMPMPGVGRVDDVAHLVLYLLSDESRYVNGAEITVDGGQVSAGGAKVLSDALRAASPDPS
jgi:3alpha(or 20beta)-hydroxysteroid dehydrogenase